MFSDPPSGQLAFRGHLIPSAAAVIAWYIYDYADLHSKKINIAKRGVKVATSRRGIAGQVRFLLLLSPSPSAMVKNNFNWSCALRMEGWRRALKKDQLFS